jgi:transposase
VTLQIVRDWVLEFNADGPDGLINRKSPGQPPRLDDTQRAAIAAMIESGPIPAIHGVVRWRVVDLCQWVLEEFHVVVAKQDPEPRTARDGVSQTLRPSASSCPGRGGH